MADLFRFCAFYVIILPCGRDNFKSFPCILLKFIMLSTYYKCSDKWLEKIKMADSLRFLFY